VAGESYDNQEKRLAGRSFHMATREKSVARVCARMAAAILILTAWTMLARPVRGQGTGGYMRCVSASGRTMAGVSTDATFNGWIPLRQATMPTAAELSAMTSEDAAAAAKEVHPPIVVVKDRDSSSLAILGAFASKQHFPEIDIAVTDHSDHPAVRYKLKDATIIAVRASVTPDAAQEPVEQLRIAYVKIEVQ
jgi:type VI protein secretion system component Hcp